MNECRLKVYQAGATERSTVRFRPCRGSADHWCDNQPSSKWNKLFGPQFIKIYKQRLRKRVKRGHGIDAFNEMSRQFYHMKRDAKRIAGTMLQEVYKSKFLQSKCAESIRRGRMLCHSIEASTKQPEKHQYLLQKLTAGCWRSDCPVAVMTEEIYMHVDAENGSLVRSTTRNPPTVSQWKQSMVLTISGSNPCINPNPTSDHICTTHSGQSSI